MLTLVKIYLHKYCLEFINFIINIYITKGKKEKYMIYLDLSLVFFILHRRIYYTLHFHFYDLGTKSIYDIVYVK